MGPIVCLLLGAVLGWTPLLAADPPKSRSREPVSSKSQNKPYAVDDESTSLKKAQAAEIDKIREASPKQIRLFHEVLNDLLTEFAYDVKGGQINGLKNISIRKISVSESLPRSYESYVELLIAERIRENSKIRLITCLPCKTKNTRIIDDRILITSPTTNADDMNRAATQLGIENFMDVVLVYHTTHMVLATQIFDTASKETVWTRTYNSETVKTRFQSLAIDAKQVEQIRGEEEYKPEFRYMIGFGAGSIPNVKKPTRETSVLGLHIRGTEKFDNRRSEFGLLLNLNIATSSFLSAYPTEGTATSPAATETESTTTREAKPFTSSVGLFAIFAHNFLGSIESYNELRFGLNAGLGLHLAPGYLAPGLRLGADTYLGRRFSVGFSLILVGTANILLDSKFVKIPGGTGADLAISYNL
ncbi:MAG: hypothetical protein NTX25_09760 [Proteobacteria bacterium]|nr:hypothetical protein [Pseudomonadota bacterium]